MNTLLWVIYLLFGFISFIPIAKIGLFKTDKRYYYFKFVSIILLFWWCIELLRLVTRHSITQYYLSLSIFPMAFLFTFFFLLSILEYFKRPMNKWIKYSLILFFCIDFIIAFTNNSHNLFVLLNLSDTISLDSFKNASLGTFFFIHTAVSYLSIIIGFILIITSLFKKFRDYGDFIPFLVVFISLFLGIGTNIIHLAVRTLPIDPSLITIIGLISVLYYVFYMRDIKLILGINRNHFILDNLREKFIITDEHNYIVETSKSFKTLLSISDEERLTFDDLKDKLSSKIVFYDDSIKFDFEIDRNK